MKKISIWAARHRLASQLILVLIHLLLIGIALKLALELYVLDWQVPAFLFWLTITGYVSCILFYPFKKHKRGLWKHSYSRQKSFDFLMVVSSFLIILITSNQVMFNLTAESNVNLNARATFISYSSGMMNETTELSKKEIRKKRKALRKRFRKVLKEKLLQIKKIKKEEGQKDNSVDKIFLFLLLILLAAGLSLLVVMGACSLACNGAGAGAMFLLLFGTAAIVIGMFFGIRAIFRNRSRVN